MSEFVRFLDGEKSVVESFSLEVKNLIPLTETSEFSASLVELNGTNRLVRNRDSSAIYQIIDGAGVFKIEINGRMQEFIVEKDDLVYIPKGVAFQDRGHLKMLSYYIPPFNPNQVEEVTKVGNSNSKKDEPEVRMIRRKEGTHFVRDGFYGDYWVRPEDGLGFSAIVAIVHGESPAKRMIKAIRNYFVVAGRGTFTIDGVTTQGKKDDFFSIPDGSTYAYKGYMKLFEFNLPATTKENYELVEGK